MQWCFAGFCLENCALIPSTWQHLSNDDCLEDKRENYQNCSVLCCVRHLCTMIRTHIWAVVAVDCWFRFRCYLDLHLILCVACLFVLVLFFCCVRFSLPSLLWRCWLADRKGMRPVKIWGDGGGGHWLVRMEWCPAGWLVCMPLLIFPCTVKFRSSLLAPAYPGGPGKGP